MIKWDEKTLKLRKEYTKLTGKNPPGINYDEYSSMTDYRNYLKTLIDNLKKWDIR